MMQKYIIIFGGTEIIMYRCIQKERSSQSEATRGRALWICVKRAGICPLVSKVLPIPVYPTGNTLISKRI